MSSGEYSFSFPKWVRDTHQVEDGTHVFEYTAIVDKIKYTGSTLGGSISLRKAEVTVISAKRSRRKNWWYRFLHPTVEVPPPRDATPNNWEVGRNCDLTITFVNRSGLTLDYQNEVRCLVIEKGIVLSDALLQTIFQRVNERMLELYNEIKKREAGRGHLAVHAA